jgi:hypothetical protein
MERIELNQVDYTSGETAQGIEYCTDLLQSAANFVFTLPVLKRCTHTVHTSDFFSDHRIIIGEPATLLMDRPYVVGFFGIRLPDPDGAITENLISVDNRLIETLAEYGVGLYNTARLEGEYINTAVLPDRSASKRWAKGNSLHQAAVNKLTPKCYKKVLKFTGEIDGWPHRCRIRVDEVILMQ